MNPGSPEWEFAFNVSKLNRHPMVWLLQWAGVKQRRPWWDRWLLFAASLLFVIATIPLMLVVIDGEGFCGDGELSVLDTSASCFSCALFLGESKNVSWSKTSRNAGMPLALLAPLGDEVGVTSPLHSQRPIGSPASHLRSRNGLPGDQWCSPTRGLLIRNSFSIAPFTKPNLIVTVCAKPLPSLLLVRVAILELCLQFQQLPCTQTVFADGSLTAFFCGLIRNSGSSSTGIPRAERTGLAGENRTLQKP